MMRSRRNASSNKVLPFGTVIRSKPPSAINSLMASKADRGSSRCSRTSKHVTNENRLPFRRDSPSKISAVAIMSCLVPLLGQTYLDLYEESSSASISTDVTLNPRHTRSKLSRKDPAPKSNTSLPLEIVEIASRKIDQR